MTNEEMVELSRNLSYLARDCGAQKVIIVLALDDGKVLTQVNYGIGLNRLETLGLMEQAKHSILGLAKKGDVV